MSSVSTAIEVKGVSKHFGEHRVLCDVNLKVKCGERLVILGGSGSGKSTLLRCMLGLERPDTGQIRMFGTDLCSAPRHRLDEMRKYIGVAFQGGALFGSLSVADNVEVPLKEFTDMSPAKRRIMARIKLGMVGLEDSMDLMPSEISGGMRKRAALARALALDPQVIFLDEPSAGLDPISAAGLDRLINKLHSTFDATFVIVTHELESAYVIADRMALLHRGQFLTIDTPEKIRASTDPIVRRFLDREPPETDDNQLEKFEAFIEELEW